MLLNISFHYNFLPILLVVFVAWITPMLLAFVQAKRIPTVIVEIIFGYVIGLIFKNQFAAADMEILNFLALSGFIFLMFLSGLEIDVDAIIASLPRKKISISGFLSNPLLVALFHFSAVIILAIAGTKLLSCFIEIPHRWYYSLILLTTSVGIIFPVLKNRGEIQSRYGQMIITAAAVADIFSIILFTFSAFSISRGFQPELLYVFGLFVLLYFLYQLGKRTVHLPFLNKINFRFSHSAVQVNIRGAMLIILLFVVISQFIGEEVILLGAFLSGLLLSGFMHRERSLLLVKLDGMGFGFFIPVFFIMVGFQFDATALLDFDHSLLLYLLILMVILFLIKIIPSLIWVRLFGKRKAIAAGFLMSSRLSLIIAASAIGLKMGVITPGINSGFILMAVVTCFFSPLIFSWINPDIKYPKKKVVIAGGSSTAILLARRLNFHARKVFIIENDPERIKEILQKGIQVVEGDAEDSGIYKQIMLQPDNPVVLETGSGEKNVRIAAMLREDFLHENIISRSKARTIEDKLRHFNVQVADERRIMAATYESLLFRPNTYHDLVESFDNFKLEEITVTNDNYHGKSVNKIPWPTNSILIMMKRGETNIIPHGTHYIKTGDILYIFGTDTAIESITAMVKKIH